MQKQSYFMLGIELYMEDFSPLKIYEEIGLRPNECKCAEKEALRLSYKDWKQSLSKYEQMPKSSPKSTNKIESKINQSEDIKIEETKAIKGFYKIHSKIFKPQSFRKECDRFIARLEKKKNILLSIKQKHNAFVVLRIYAFVNKKDIVGLNLSLSVSRFCASLGARILTQIKVL